MAEAVDEFYELTLPEEKIREMIGTEFEELVLEEAGVRNVVASDILKSVFGALAGGSRPSWMKTSYDEKVHELYRSIRKRQ